MRWFPKPEPQPDVGRIRERRRYAWLPIRLIDGSWIWFERFYIVEEYKTWNELVPTSYYSEEYGGCNYESVAKYGWKRVAVRLP